MLASYASHVIAPLIFFDASFAARTRLSICHYPLNIRTFCRVLFFPLNRNFAFSWLVALVATQKAERSTTVTPHFGYRGVNAFLVTQLASLSRTPLNSLVIVGVGFAKPFPISFKLFRRKKSLKDAVAYFHIAICLHALCVDTGATFIDLVWEILTPASDAEGMATWRQWKPLLRCQSVIANWANTSIKLHQARVDVRLFDWNLLVVKNPKC